MVNILLVQEKGQERGLVREERQEALNATWLHGVQLSPELDLMAKQKVQQDRETAAPC